MRSPTASQGEGGALGEEEARKRGNTVGIRDQAMDLAKLNGHKITRVLFDTPDTMPDLPNAGSNRKSQIAGLGNQAKSLVNLPTPIATDWKNGKSSEGFGMNLSETAKLFPTPNTMDYLPARTPEQKEANKGKGGYANVRETVVNDLLPTTETSMKNGATQKEIDAGNPKFRIEAVTNWGKFEPAIKRWEQVIGRKAPAPTKPDGKDGSHRLSSAFTEWMMGVPEGWITDCGLSRNDELKACGNGVVPQQAELALRILLEGIAFESTSGRQVNLPTPTVSDIFTDKLASSQQKEGSMHSVTLPQAVRMVSDNIERGQADNHDLPS